MRVFMLKGTFPDGHEAFYKRSGPYGDGKHWVDQEKASIWTTPQGPSGAKGAINEYYEHRKGKNKPEIERIEYVLMSPAPFMENGNVSCADVHFGPEGDGVQALYLGGKLYTYGDAYHDKISTLITGIIDGLTLLCPNVVTDLFYVPIAECSGICYDGETPPGTFENCLKEFPVSSTYPE